MNTILNEIPIQLVMRRKSWVKYATWSHMSTQIHNYAYALTLTHWGPVTHICVVKLTIIGSDNGLSPGRRQALIWTNAVILLIGPLGTNFIAILIEIIIVSFKKMRLKVSSAIRWPFCLGLNVLRHSGLVSLETLVSIGSCVSLPPDRHQAISWTSNALLLIWPLGTNFGEIENGIPQFSYKEIIWKCRLWNGSHFVPASMCYAERIRSSPLSSFVS